MGLSRRAGNLVHCETNMELARERQRASGPEATTMSSGTSLRSLSLAASVIEYLPGSVSSTSTSRWCPHPSSFAHDSAVLPSCALAYRSAPALSSAIAILTYSGEPFYNFESPGEFWAALARLSS